MAKTAWERFQELAANGPVNVRQMEAAGIKFPSTYTSQWTRCKPPRVVCEGTDAHGYKLYRLAVPKDVPAAVPGLDALLDAQDDDGTPEVHVLKGHSKDDAPAPKRLDLPPIHVRPAAQQEAPKPGPSMDELVMQLADKLAQSIALQVQARLEDYLTQVIESKLAPLPEAVRMDVELPLPTAPVKHKGEKLHVCIGGLLPQQVHLIQKEFGADMQLDFLGADHNAKSVQEKLSHADAAFVMTKFIGHWLDRKFADAKVPVFQRINGGMTRLRDCLTSLYVSS